MFTLLAPAKINLYLKVLYKRPDGYHEIDSVMQAVSLFDRLTFHSSSRVQVLAKGHPIPQKDNLVTKALRLLQEYTGVKRGIRVVIDKKIPVAAGLGGGSSDAATALLGACRLWQTPLSKSELALLGSQVGSDVPFFFTSGQARAQGRGEILSKIVLPADYSIFLVCPAFSVSTPWAYQALNLSLTTGRNGANFLLTEKNRVIGENPRSSPRALPFSNDLEAPVIRRFPEIERVKKAFVSSGFDPVVMSGSGPTVWAAFPPNPGRQTRPDEMGKERAMIRKILVRSDLTLTPRLFIVRPLTACANISVGGRSA